MPSVLADKPTASAHVVIKPQDTSIENLSTFDADGLVADLEARPEEGRTPFTLDRRLALLDYLFDQFSREHRVSKVALLLALDEMGAWETVPSGPAFLEPFEVVPRLLLPATSDGDIIRPYGGGDAVPMGRVVADNVVIEKPLPARRYGGGQAIIEKVRSHGGGATITKETPSIEPGPPVDPNDPPAFRAFKQLGQWLNAEDGHVAAMLGFGRTTPYQWKRTSTEPRVGTVRRLYEYHATVGSLHRYLGADELRRWLHVGAPSTRRDTLLAGRLEDLERDVYDALFRGDPETRLAFVAAPEDAGEAAAHEGQAPRASRRRPRRPPA